MSNVCSCTNTKPTRLFGFYYSEFLRITGGDRQSSYRLSLYIVINPQIPLISSAAAMETAAAGTLADMFSPRVATVLPTFERYSHIGPGNVI